MLRQAGCATSQPDAMDEEDWDTLQLLGGAEFDSQFAFGSAQALLAGGIGPGDLDQLWGTAPAEVGKTCRGLV
jgi:hypothetical protein